jgi:signal transduction histidine kinase
MYESLIEVDLLNGQNEDQGEQPVTQQSKQTWQSADDVAREVSTLMLVIDASTHALRQPMDEVLRLSDRLQPQINPDSPLADDLATIVQKVRQMNEIAKGLNLLTNYENDSPQRVL